MSEFVPQYYRMDPETEDVLFGHQLKNDMRVLIEGSAHRADPATQAISFTDGNRTYLETNMPDDVEDAAMRQNRWCKVTQFLCEDGEIHFVGKYDDGIKHVRSRDMYLGWIVKKDTIPEGWVEAKEQVVPEIVKWNAAGIAKKYCERMGLKMVPIDEATAENVVEAMRDAVEKIKGGSAIYLDKAGVAAWMGQQEDLTEVTTAESLKTAGYSNVAISQIMRLTEKRVKEILERHAETPFLKQVTRQNLLDDLESGRLRLEVPPMQDGRDVTAIIKPGPMYRPEPKNAAAHFQAFMKEHREFFNSRNFIRLPELAQMFNGEWCTREDNEVGWQLNHETIERLAKSYWGEYDELTYEFSDYLGFGLTAGQIMARDMVQRGDPTKG